MIISLPSVSYINASWIKTPVSFQLFFELKINLIRAPDPEKPLPENTTSILTLPWSIIGSGVIVIDSPEKLISFTTDPHTKFSHCISEE